MARAHKSESKGPGRWHARGLRFQCTGCGNCCSGGPGYVWIKGEEVARLAAFLGISPQETLEKYCRKVGGGVSLRERHTHEGNFDCVFLKMLPPDPHPEGDELEQVKLVRRGCSIYSVRPLQCRVWPFWPEIVASREGWALAGKRCHGIDQGRLFTEAEIAARRDAKDWPEEE